ncbi:MAG: PspC domain-containing protein [Raoultibacter sp.]
MYNDKTLYRSRDALAGGVCAGIAEYFTVDPVLVRIIMVVITLASGGLLTVFYIAMWVILPKKPLQPRPLETKPESVHSETYGAINYAVTSVGSTAKPPAPPAPVSPPPPAAPGFFGGTTTSSVGIGHIPPSPPGVYAAAASSQVPIAAVTPGSAPTPASSSSSAKPLLWLGLVLLFCGVAALLGGCVEGVSWWRFWPLLFVLIGISQMAIPGNDGYTTRQFSKGLVSFAFGGVALCISLGLVSLGSVFVVLDQLWPLLLIMVGLSVLATAMKSPVFTLLSACVFVAFCILGLLFFALPGFADCITFKLPFGSYSLLNPWV